MGRKTGLKEKKKNLTKTIAGSAKLPNQLNSLTESPIIPELCLAVRPKKYREFSILVAMFIDVFLSTIISQL